jgi:3-hydroxyisobutyrate dehydrogenase
MKAGFIGLGHLGKAIANRLISQGVDLIVWNRTPGKANDMGVEIAENPATLALKVPVIILNLFDSSAVRSVLEGDNGLLESDIQGKLVIDTTTNHFDDVAYFHDLIRSHGGQYLESPVLGSVGHASQGTLSILASGEKNAYEKALPYLQKIGKSIFYLEKPTLSTKMKLVNNLILGTFMATLAEAVTFGEAIGLDKSKVLDILDAGAGNSGILHAKRDTLIREDFSPQFQSALIYKDLHYLEELAFELKKPLFIGSVVKELYGMTYSLDEEMLDFSALYKIFKDY